MTDKQRDVAERLEEEAATALRNADVEEGWATSDAPASEDEARQINRWKALAARNRRMAALMLEAAALLRSEGREPDAWQIEWTDESGGVAYRQGQKPRPEHLHPLQRAVPLYRGTPSDSPKGPVKGKPETYPIIESAKP